MPLFEQDYLCLLELSNILEPKRQYSFDFTFSSISKLASLDAWDEEIDGPTPVEKNNSTPQNWYT